MKQKRLSYPVLALILFIAVSFRHDETPVRRALIVAIGNYQAGNNWANLSSLRDDTIVTKALEKQGFTDIRHIINENATADGIRKAFQSLSADVNPGDIVYIHFSSHGQQIWDDNGDELDGYDEAIVCWDGPSRYFNGYKGDKHLRDDELGELVKSVRAAAGSGGDVLVCVDACHSGTALRGDITRGNQGALAPPDFNPLNVKRTEDAGTVDGFTVETSDMAPVVLFSASRAFEPNQEYKGYGSLSLALTQSFNKLRQGDSYRTLFAYIAAEMNVMQLRQVPVMEGKTDRSIFGGKEVKQSNYFNVRLIMSGNAVIDAGTLSGLYKGSKVAFMPAGSTEYAADKAIFTATIASADMSKAYVMHNGELKDYVGTPKMLWAFVVEQAYGSNKLLVGPTDDLTGKNRSEVKDNVKKLTYTEWTDKDPDIYVGIKDGKYTLELRDGTLVYEGLEYIGAVNLKIDAYMQGKLMREAEFADPDIKVELLMTPRMFLGWDDEGNAILENVDSAKQCIGGIWEVNHDNVMFLTLRNSGMKDAYISILEIDPAGVVEVVLPDYENNENAFDFLLPAGKTVPVENFARRLGPRNGKYTFKVFATSVPVSFRSIYLTRGAPDKDEYVHPAAQLFQYSYRTRGENLAVKKTSGGGTTKEYIIRYTE